MSHKVRIYVQRDLDVLVSGKVLHRLNVGTGHDQLSYVSVAEQVRSDLEINTNLYGMVSDFVSYLELMGNRLSVFIFYSYGPGAADSDLVEDAPAE